MNLWNFSAVEFQDDKKFTSYNNWECGNDCFTATFGTYEFTGNKKIRLMTDSVITTGTCAAPAEIIKNKMEENFKIVKAQEKIVLTRIR